MRAEIPALGIDLHVLAIHLHALAIDLHVLAFDPHVLAFDPHVLALDPHIPAIDPHAPAFDPHILAIDPHALAFDPHILAIDLHALAFDPRVRAIDLHALAFDPRVRAIDSFADAIDLVADAICLRGDEPEHDMEFAPVVTQDEMSLHERSGCPLNRRARKLRAAPSQRPPGHETVRPPSCRNVARPRHTCAQAASRNPSYPVTAASVISSALSITANASFNCSSVMQGGGVGEEVVPVDQGVHALVAEVGAEFLHFGAGAVEGGQGVFGAVAVELEDAASIRQERRERQIPTTSGGRSRRAGKRQCYALACRGVYRSRFINALRRDPYRTDQA